MGALIKGLNYTIILSQCDCYSGPIVLIFRYFAKEIYTTLAVVSGVLVLIFLSNQLVRYLSRAAAGKMGTAVVVKMLALQIPYLFGLLLPLGFFIALMMSYGRLYVDNEMTVLSACGFSRKQLINYSLLLSIVVFVLVAVLNFFVTPRLLNYEAHLKNLSQADQIIQTVMPGRFQIAGGGRMVFYLEDIDHDKGEVENVFVALRDKKKTPDAPEHWNVATAASAHQETDPATGDNFIVAQDGYRYDGEPGGKEFKIIKFRKYGLRTDSQAPQTKQRFSTASTKELLKQYETSSRAAAEFQWRLSMPLSIPILTLLGVALSRVKPRQGRFAQLLPAILLYTVYANMLFVARDWLEDGIVPRYVGLWWLHGALLLVALLCLIDGHTWAKWRSRWHGLWRRSS
tara:strand:- start:16262 stop:17461 length:1200 start_codon:yes stop_codon:yes gene_type:complete